MKAPKLQFFFQYGCNIHAGFEQIIDEKEFSCGLNLYGFARIVRKEWTYRLCRDETVRFPGTNTQLLKKFGKHHFSNLLVDVHSAIPCSGLTSSLA